MQTCGVSVDPERSPEGFPQGRDTSTCLPRSVPENWGSDFDAFLRREARPECHRLGHMETLE